MATPMKDFSADAAEGEAPSSLVLLQANSLALTVKFHHSRDDTYFGSRIYGQATTQFPGHGAFMQLRLESVMRPLRTRNSELAIFVADWRQR